MGGCGNLRSALFEVLEQRNGKRRAEIERRLLELGFLEGARVRVLHEGLFGRDPIAVRVNGATVALRRSEAMAILIRQGQS